MTVLLVISLITNFCCRELTTQPVLLSAVTNPHAGILSQNQILSDMNFPPKHKFIPASRYAAPLPRGETKVDTEDEILTAETMLYHI